MSDYPRRLSAWTYRGPHRYFLTFCCNHRRAVFVDAEVVAVALEQILRSATRHAFAVIAYCFMPDHLHLLIEGRDDASSLIAFARDIKQRTGYRWRGKADGVLWQDGYYERVLRGDEQTLSVAKYILENPVRAGLVREPGDYPHAGSLVFTWPQLLELWDIDPGSRFAAT
jgi:REP-associated tyrosine transposase